MDVKDPSAFDALLKAIKGKPKKYDLVHESQNRYSTLHPTWADLVRNLARPKDLGKRGALSALRHYLVPGEATLDEASYKGKSGDKKTDRSKAAREWIATFVNMSMAPIAGGATPREKETKRSRKSGDDNAAGEDTTSARERARALGPDGIAILTCLSQSQTLPMPLTSDQLFTLISFTDPTLRMPPNTVASASALLETSFSKTVDKQSFIANDVLQAYLRPLFSRARPPSVTSAGRPTAFGSGKDTRASGVDMETKINKPWKFEDMRAIPTLRWAIETANRATISTHMTLFTPPLLTLIDDPTTSFREQGLVLLLAFMKKASTSRLRATGLGRVLENAIFPTLMYLPSLTPESESVQLLNAAYPLLMQLVGEEPAAADMEEKEQRMELLERMMGEGIIAAFAHSKEHARIAEALAEHTVPVIQAMKLDAVKYLKDLVPMVSTIATDPFAMSHPPAVESSLKLLKTITENCWPRIGSPAWHGEITRIIVECGLVVFEGLNGPDDIARADEITGKPGTGAIIQHLVVDLKLLAAAMKAMKSDVPAAFGPLAAQKEPWFLDFLFSEHCK